MPLSFIMQTVTIKAGEERKFDNYVWSGFIKAKNMCSVIVHVRNSSSEIVDLYPGDRIVLENFPPFSVVAQGGDAELFVSLVGRRMRIIRPKIDIKRAKHAFTFGKEELYNVPPDASREITLSPSKTARLAVLQRAYVAAYPSGASSGSHKAEVFVDGSKIVEIESNYNKGLVLRNNYPYLYTSISPAEKDIFVMMLQNIRLGDAQTLKLKYTNNTDVTINNVTLALFMLEEVVE